MIKTSKKYAMILVPSAPAIDYQNTYVCSTEYTASSLHVNYTTGP